MKIIGETNISKPIKAWHKAPSVFHLPECEEAVGVEEILI